MKIGRPLAELAKEITETISRREDFVVPGSVLRMRDSGDRLSLNRDMSMPDNNSSIHMTDTAHHNLSRRLEIPKPYYDRMRGEAPLLLAENVNEWLRKSNNHMVRTLSSDWGKPKLCRAVLSDRYKVIDNDVVLEGLFPILQENAGMEVVSCEITPTKFFLKARFPTLERDVGLNDPVQSGVVISNSEVGQGGVSVAMLIYRLVCLNGMVVPFESFKARRNHIGGKLDFDDNFSIIASDETTKLQDQAFLASLKDVVRAAADPDVFHEAASKLQAANTRGITGNVEEAVQRVTKHLTLTQSEGDSVLENLVRDGNYTQWGLANAVTRTAQDIESYDRASELERMGGRVINLRPSEWGAIAA